MLISNLSADLILTIISGSRRRAFNALLERFCDISGDMRRMAVTFVDGSRLLSDIRCLVGGSGAREMRRDAQRHRSRVPLCSRRPGIEFATGFGLFCG